jgi:hypothetical protein
MRQGGEIRQEPDMTLMEIGRMRITCWITKAADTFRLCNKVKVKVIL